MVKEGGWEFRDRIAATMSFFQIVMMSGAMAAAQHNLTVAAYLPEWRYEGANWRDMSEVVNQLILFSLEVTPIGRLPHLTAATRSSAEARLTREWREAAGVRRRQWTFCRVSPPSRTRRSERALSRVL